MYCNPKRYAVPTFYANKYVVTNVESLKFEFVFG